MAIDGSTAVVGAPLNDSAATNAGAVYVLERNVGGADSWGLAATLTASLSTGSIRRFNVAVFLGDIVA